MGTFLRIIRGERGESHDDNDDDTDEDKAGDIAGLFRGLGGDFASLYSTFLCGLDQFKYPSISALTPTTSDGTESILHSASEEREK